MLSIKQSKNLPLVQPRGGAMSTLSESLCVKSLYISANVRIVNADNF